MKYGKNKKDIPNWVKYRARPACV